MVPYVALHLVCCAALHLYGMPRGTVAHCAPVKIKHNSTARYACLAAMLDPAKTIDS